MERATVRRGLIAVHAEHLAELLTALHDDGLSVVADDPQLHLVAERQQLKEATTKGHLVVATIDAAEGGLERPLVSCLAALPAPLPFSTKIGGGGGGGDGCRQQGGNQSMT